jgi:uncharacterized membrane protein YidH (DUF202 family)
MNDGKRNVFAFQRQLAIQDGDLAQLLDSNRRFVVDVVLVDLFVVLVIGGGVVAVGLGTWQWQRQQIVAFLSHFGL